MIILRNKKAAKDQLANIDFFKKNFSKKYRLLRGEKNFENLKRRELYNLGWRSTIEKIIKHGRIESSSNVLEVGCGYGRVIIGLKYYFPILNIKGIDITEDAISICKYILKKEGFNNNVELKVATSENMPYSSETFDAAVFVRVFQYLFDPIASLVECKRTLKNNGRIVIIIPNILNPKQYLFYKTKLYSLHILKNWLSDIGYSDILCETYRYLPLNLNYNSLCNKFEILFSKMPIINLFGGLIVISGRK